ncbi:alpha-amylase family glycosyl hydrolase [Paenibacillus cellulositrophicus]|uniref:alpha-amylase family glycosyl hydrolase n=1 Tax=Paenibacillus cellulositrophicus TaxID=562959 RepID=UPI001FCC0359|nr:alpha-amylase family glycosyl hydrolase [Paenibacillus cellulositrophicus]
MKTNKWGMPAGQQLRRLAASVTAVIMAVALLSGCSSTGNHAANDNGAQERQPDAEAGSQTAEQQGQAGTGTTAGEQLGGTAATAVDEQPSTVFYEVFVRSFYDSNGDGIGDLKGLTQKLDYLNDGNLATTDDLGVGGIWLMPIQPSPSYHGYDITDYEGINPDYGTLEDLQELIAEAHKRGIKVIMDLVLNHTSTQHPWFVSASKDPGSKYRDWYVWAEDQKLSPTGVSAAGSGSPWHALNGSHYLATFWEGMPDLNYDNPEVRAEAVRIGQYWLKLGMDGFRVDGAKHIYENLQSDRGQAATAKNTAWWQEFRTGMNPVNKEAYIVGEVWENSAAAIAPYLDQAFDSGFNFSLAESILSAVKDEKDNSLAFTLQRTQQFYGKQSQGQFTDAIFLSNHDQDHVMSQLDGNPDHARMAAALLLTLPGNPFIYYGEEIGMRGVKPDERIREPMVWSDLSPQPGQTSWEQPLLTGEAAKGISVQSESADPNSLLSTYRDLIRWREDVPALRDGDIQSYDSGNPAVVSFVRRSAQQTVLVLHNLSGKEQQVQLEAGQGRGIEKVLKSSSKSTVLEQNLLHIPPYSSVVLE